MLDSLHVQEIQAGKNLFDVVFDCVFREVPVLRKNVSQTGLHLLQVNAEKLVK